MSKPNQTCGTCRWWNLLEEGAERPAGYCRRKAPPAQLVDDSGECSPEVVWPLTNDYDWCGEWEISTTEQDQQFQEETKNVKIVHDLVKLGEADIIFRYPTGRTKRLVRQGKIAHIVLPDGEIRIRRQDIEALLTKTEPKEPEVDRRTEI